MDVQFHSKEAFNFDRMAVAFPALVDGKRVNCFISLEALQDHFGLRGSDPIPTFQENRRAIENAAEKKLRAGDLEKDGTIIIRSGEC